MRWWFSLALGRRRRRVYLLLLPIGLAVLVGGSRMYLGVHWPTDVLSGWTAGAVWALLWWAAARVLQARGWLDPVDAPTPRAA